MISSFQEWATSKLEDYQIKRARHALRGKYGFCTVCGLPADFIVKETKAPLCGKVCLVRYKQGRNAREDVRHKDHERDIRKHHSQTHERKSQVQAPKTKEKRKDHSSSSRSSSTQSSLPTEAGFAPLSSSSSSVSLASAPPSSKSATSPGDENHTNSSAVASSSSNEKNIHMERSEISSSPIPAHEGHDDDRRTSKPVSIQTNPTCNSSSTLLQSTHSINQSVNTSHDTSALDSNVTSLKSPSLPAISASTKKLQSTARFSSSSSKLASHDFLNLHVKTISSEPKNFSSSYSVAKLDTLTSSHHRQANTGHIDGNTAASAVNAMTPIPRKPTPKPLSLKRTSLNAPKLILTTGNESIDLVLNQGKYGNCCVCSGPANHIVHETKQALCGKQCLAHYKRRLAAVKERSRIKKEKASVRSGKVGDDRWRQLKYKASAAGGVDLESGRYMEPNTPQSKPNKSRISTPSTTLTATTSSLSTRGTCGSLLGSLFEQYIGKQFYSRRVWVLVIGVFLTIAFFYISVVGSSMESADAGITIDQAPLASEVFVSGLDVGDRSRVSHEHSDKNDESSSYYFFGPEEITDFSDELFQRFSTYSTVVVISSIVNSAHIGANEICRKTGRMLIDGRDFATRFSSINSANAYSDNLAQLLSQVETAKDEYHAGIVLDLPCASWLMHSTVLSSKSSFILYVYASAKDVIYLEAMRAQSLAFEQKTTEFLLSDLSLSSSSSNSGETYHAGEKDKETESPKQERTSLAVGDDEDIPETNQEEIDADFVYDMETEMSGGMCPYAFTWLKTEDKGLEDLYAPLTRSDLIDNKKIQKNGKFEENEGQGGLTNLIIPGAVNALQVILSQAAQRDIFWRDYQRHQIPAERQSTVSHKSVIDYVSSNHFDSLFNGIMDMDITAASMRLHDRDQHNLNERSTDTPETDIETEEAEIAMQIELRDEGSKEQIEQNELLPGSLISPFDDLEQLPP